MRVKHLDGVILDLDCLVVEFNQLQARAWCKALAEQGFSVSIEKVQALSGLDVNELLAHLVGITTNNKRGQVACERHLEILRQSLPSTELQLLPGTTQLLKKWRDEGLHITVISQALSEKLQLGCKEVADKELLVPNTSTSAAFTSQSNGPDVDVMELALRKLDCSAGRVMLVSGSAHYIKLALKHGIPLIILRYKELVSQASIGATEIYEHPTELLEKYENSGLSSSVRQLNS